MPQGVAPAEGMEEGDEDEEDDDDDEILEMDEEEDFYEARELES